MKVDDLGNMMPNVVRDTNDRLAMFCQTELANLRWITRCCPEIELNHSLGSSFTSRPMLKVVSQDDGEDGRSVRRVDVV